MRETERERAREHQNAVVAMWNQRLASIMADPDISVEDGILALERLYCELLAAYTDCTERLGDTASRLESAIYQRDGLAVQASTLARALNSEMFNE